MHIDDKNEMFGLAVELVNQTSRNIFLTGKAGTGKTTFLKHIKETCPKQLAVVAPTGVAAINAGGVTIHSFFQLPLAPFLPDGRSAGSDLAISKHDLLSRLRLTTEKRRVLNQLELLIIDEVSMVRCDVIDAIDVVLRHVRSRIHEPFGGVQVLFIGDLYQLPPVVREPEWRIIREVYEAPFFFNSHVIIRNPPLYVEFEHIYRQTDETFIDVLNKVRNNRIDDVAIEVLESRFRPGFHPNTSEEYILLTTHNETARDINHRELEKLPGESSVFRAVVKGDFADNAFPADELLELKVGAQVMFLKNDSDRAKRYYNGKIGIITVLEGEKISVKCRGEDDEIEVTPEVWRNIRYSLDQKTQKLDEEELGSYTQYPLRLAWAITIHKSQGLTFDKAIIDAGQSFAPGQVYVALSRCRSLEGMVLKSKIRPNTMLTDGRIIRYSESAISSEHLKKELQFAIVETREQILLNSFDVVRIAKIVRDMYSYLKENHKSFNSSAQTWIETISGVVSNLEETSTKFHAWLRSRFVIGVLPGDIDDVRERSVRAALHFIGEFRKVADLLRSSPVETDSLEHSKTFNEWARELFAEISLKNYLLQEFDGRMDISTWYKRRNAFEMPAFRVNAYSAAREASDADAAHPDLYRRLRIIRDQICRTHDLPVYMVASGATLNEMARYLPQTLDELKGISGFGEVRVRKYGKQFVEAVHEYCSENDLESLMEELEIRRPVKKPKQGNKRGKPDTKAETFRMYNEGLDVSQIAKERGLAVATIENHLSHFVSAGKLNIKDLLSPDKIERINEVISKHENSDLKTIKGVLGDDYSFSEIRMVFASLRAHSEGNDSLPDP